MHNPADDRARRQAQLLAVFLPPPDEEFVLDAVKMLREGQKTSVTDKNTETKNGAGDKAGSGGAGSLNKLDKFDCDIPSLIDMQKEGIPDWDCFLLMIEGTYVQLAHCAELLRAQMSAMAGGIGGAGVGPNGM